MHNDTRQPVEFDLDTLRLTIGEHSTIVSHPALGNEAVLRSYLSLVAEVRGTPIGSGIQIRQDDIVVLAQVLDLSDADLESDLARLLGVSSAMAAEVGRRLRRRRAFAAAASLTVGGLALLGATKVAASPAPQSPAPVPVVTTMPAPEMTTTVGAPEVTSTTVADLPPVTTPPPVTSAPHTHPTSPDDVQIGDALVIERGQQPADPSTQIDNAVTYER